MALSLIWDLDGTLIDSYEVISMTVRDTLREIGIELSLEEIRRRATVLSVSSILSEEGGRKGFTYEQLKPRYTAISKQWEETIRPYPDALETLERLREAGVRSFIYTHRGVTAKPIMERTGLAPFFEDVVDSTMEFPRKPAPDGILYLMEKHGLPEEETFYVGDRTIDMDCAKNAGIRGILYLEEGTAVRPNGSETYTVNQLSEIPGIPDLNI